MNLCNIPDVALREIVEFLDEKSLAKLQQSCRALCCFIKNNPARKVDRLVQRVYDMKITRLDNSAPNMPSYSVCLECGYDYYPGPGMYPIRKDTKKTFSFTYSIEHDVLHSPLLEWLVRTFSNVQIASISLRNIRMEEERTTDKLALILRKHQLLVAEIILSDSQFSDSNVCRMVKFLTDISPSTFVFANRRLRNPEILLTKPFLDYMSTVPSFRYFCGSRPDMYESLKLEEFPIYIDKIPPEFHTSNAFTMNFGQLQKLLHKWYNNGKINISYWEISIIDNRRIEKIGKDLALPFKEYANDSITIQRPIEGVHQFIKIRRTKRHNQPTGAYEWKIFG